MNDELDLGLEPVAAAKKGRQQHKGTDGDPNEVHIRSFPDQRAARMVMQMCWGRIAFTAAEVAYRAGIELGLAARLCDRAVEWKWAYPADKPPVREGADNMTGRRGKDGERLFVGRL